MSDVASIMKREHFNMVWVGKALPKQLCVHPDSIEMMTGLDRTTMYPLEMRDVIEYMKVPHKALDVYQYFHQQNIPSEFTDLLARNGDIIRYPDDSEDLREFRDVMFMPYGRLWDKHGAPSDEPSDDSMMLRGFTSDYSMNIDPVMQRFLFVDRDAEDVPTRTQVVARDMGVSVCKVTAEFLTTFGDILEADAAYLVHKE